MSSCSYVSARDSDVEDLTEIFRVLGDPTRVRILDVLSRAEVCVQDLAGALKLSESAVSHQLRLLRARGSCAPGAPAATCSTPSTITTCSRSSSRGSATPGRAPRRRTLMATRR
jgi:hypothetical protein